MALQILLLCKHINLSDFSVLKTHYHTILHLMPGDYELTLGKLQDYINDDQNCASLSSSNSTIANKIANTGLFDITHEMYREDVLQLCELLEGIALSTSCCSTIQKPGALLQVKPVIYCHDIVLQWRHASKDSSLRNT